MKRSLFYATTAIGLLGLTFCGVTLFQWVGVMDTARSIAPYGSTLSTDQRVVGVYGGVFYRWSWQEGTMIMPIPQPVKVQRERKWGTISPSGSPRSTILGYSNIGYGAGIGGRFYHVSQWSFPVWLFCAGCLLPSIVLVPAIWRRRRRLRDNLCRK